MIRKTDYTDKEYVLHPHRWSVVRGNISIPFFYVDVVYTQHGFVFVRRWADNHTECTTMTFIWNGCEHTRRWEKWWADKTVTQLAREMMEEIVRSTVHE